MRRLMRVRSRSVREHSRTAHLPLQGKGDKANVDVVLIRVTSPFFRGGEGCCREM